MKGFYAYPTKFKDLMGVEKEALTSFFHTVKFGDDGCTYVRSCKDKSLSPEAIRALLSRIQRQYGYSVRKPLKKAFKPQIGWSLGRVRTLAFLTLGLILLLIALDVKIKAEREHKVLDSVNNINVSPVRFYEYELESLLLGKGVKKAYASEGDVKSLIEEYFGEYSSKAITCFKTESGLKAQAFNGKNKNGTWDAGVAQVNQIHCPKIGLTGEDCKQALFDPATNLDLAYKIFKGRGYNFSAWYGTGCRAYW